MPENEFTPGNPPDLQDVCDSIAAVQAELTRVKDFLEGAATAEAKRDMINAAWARMWLENRAALLPPTTTITCGDPPPRMPGLVAMVALMSDVNSTPH